MSEEKKNILLWGFTGKHICDLQSHLDHDINIKVWVGRKKYPEITHNLTDFDRALHTSKRNYQLKIKYQHRKEYIDIYEKVMRQANTFLYMYSRHPSLNGENNFLDMMDAFHIYIHFFIDLIKTNKITSVLFHEVPHHADFILYHVAKELDVKVLIFSNSMCSALALNKSVVAADITEIGSIETSEVNITPIKIEKKKKYIYKYKKKKNLYVKAISALLFRRDMDLFFHRVMNIRKNLRFKKDYKCTVSDLPSEEKFVYFPLHLQPEMTTQSLGGKFVDQVLAIECLRALLPDEWNIAVKENPVQTFHSRGSLFFARLRKIPRVFYLGKEHDTFELIEKSEFVSTITGTAGLEALNFGKRVLIFGDSIYRNFPGVIRYTRNLTFNDIMSTQFSHDDLELTYAKLKKNMLDATVSKSYINLNKNFSADKNTKILAAAINENAE